jgi:hypothetical protein
MGTYNHFINDSFITEASVFMPDSFDCTIDESIFFTEHILFNNGLSLTLSLDTDRYFASMHTLPMFNSFCEVEGVIYASGDMGIHRLTGDTDNGAAIHTGMVWKSTDFGLTESKRVRFAILTGNVEDAIIQAETGTGTGVYPVVRHRAQFGRNLLGRNWSVRIADFTRLESAEFFLIVPKR